MDEKIIKIVAARLRRMEGQPINQEKLESIRESVYSATRSNKSASFSNVKKWIKGARSMIKRQEKEASRAAKAKKPAKQAKKAAKGAKHPSPAEHQYREPFVPEVSRRVEDSVNMIKEESIMPAPLQEVQLAKPTIVFDKVYLQSIKFEIAGIRQTMERVSRQLDKLERELTEHRSED
ncbi:Uncharacterised protein [uncultured archaeon]|nr:Uncharacterised protein [uncultured archaeon]